MTVDVLIVGAGSAGSILAERLSADPARQVMVLEAGPDRRSPGIRALTDDATVLPIGAGSPVAHRYRTALTRDSHHPAWLVRGSCLGGSGAINGGYFCPAVPSDFHDASPGWSWAQVEPHCRAVATDLDFPDPRGGGPVAVRRAAIVDGPSAEFVAAADAAGFEWLPDLNAVGAESGVAAVPLNIVDGLRAGPGAAFLEPAIGRPNLQVLTGVRATRVRIRGGRAVGAEVIGPAGPGVIEARTVVLCAGAIASAQLLMLSGVGPTDALGALDIPVAVDLPVGVGFSDHPEWLMRTEWPASRRRPPLEAILVTDRLEVRPYTSSFEASSRRAGVPDLGVVLTRPRARGRLTLVSPDLAVPPRIEHRYDEAPADIAELRDGCAMVREILKSSTKLGDPRWSTSQHLCGTAPMGANGSGVVDERCRVRGIDGLAVVDGSVLARVPRRGPHATIAMLAHRAAEFF